ncbi:hypothetical protein KEM52_006374 [Ascosphaera acerosa]|nr:hypothetical protein KEM52_006374 [Ascosphaera acerosa]
MQGFNMGRYVPPDVEGLQSGNQLHGKHALGARARNLHTTGELTVRFEMPFNVWCLHCDPHGQKVLIGQGVRFNAFKRRVGNYFSTPIWAFRMKHSLCGQWIEIRTDPKNTAYVVTEGARRQDKGLEEVSKGQYVDEDAIAEAPIRLPGADEVEKAKDAFEEIEKKAVDKRQTTTEQLRLKQLYMLSDRHWDDPYEQSRKLRRTFRQERRRREAATAADEALKNRFGLGLDLLEESESDRLRAGLVQFQQPQNSQQDILDRRVMFDAREAEMPGETQHVSTGIHRKRRSTSHDGDRAPLKKAQLQRELRGNTKVARDPFLAVQGWEPAPRSKHKDARASKASAAPAASTEPSGRTTLRAHELHGPGNTAYADVDRDEANHEPAKEGRPLLVDYDSASD